MLVIKRRDGESLVIGDNIVIKQLSGGRIGIDAPKDVRVLRSELIGRERTPPKDPRRN